MPDRFVHLHLHTDYSLLDGLGKIDAYMKRAGEYGMRAMAITDHGVLYGAVNFYQAAHQAGIKPIVGCEMYVAPRGMRQKQGRDDAENYHLVLLAKNETGYKNLIKLVSLAHTEGFYYKPRVDHELLAAHAEGLVCLSACLAAEVPRLLVAERYEDARERAIKYQRMFGEGNYFLELQHHPSIPEQALVNRGVSELGKELGIPLVCTADVHYVDQADMAIQDVLICIQTGKTLDDPKRLKMTSDTNFFRSPDEMAELFRDVPEAVANTARVAELCELEIRTGVWVLPHFPVPEGRTTEEHLRERAEDGLRRRLAAGRRRGDGGRAATEEADKPVELAPTGIPVPYQERLDYELDIIAQKGYPAYFLIVQDYATWSREQGIAITTRGSAAGSLVSYALGITSVDPLVYDLPFERFLNPYRPSPPDIDMDFEDSRREEVIEYVTRKYGADKVAQIITFGAMEAKLAVRDVGRVMGLSYGEVDRVAKLIPNMTGLDRALESVPDLHKLYEGDPQVAKLLDTARRLEGVTRNAGTHAAGVIITEQPIAEYAPVQKDTGGGDKAVIQYDMRNAEAIGLMKMDFLGLANLSVLGRAVKIIKEYRGLDLDPDTLPLDDGPTYALLATGETTGLFQVESGGMRKYLKDLKPSDILDIAAMIALYRPGPMPMIPAYIERKHDPSKVEYLDPSLEPLLKDSYGVLVYQDDILLISIEIAGYNWEQADKFRKAVGKKDLALLAEQQEKFVKGCQQHGGLTKEKAQELWDWMLPFARYGFNKCASAQTKVELPDGRKMTLAAAYREQPAEIMAMWPDGRIRPHRVQRIVKTGRKELLKVTTKSRRVIKVTPEHRLLTTEGYKRADELRAGMELITVPRRVTENMRRARRENMTRLNQSEAQRLRVSARVRQYQADRPLDEKIAHMKRMHELHPEMTRNAVAAMHERVTWLWTNDPVWRQKQVEVSLASVRACYDTGPGYGYCSIASNGMWCASQPERDMCEWLSAQGVDFAMYKVLPNGRICDFYFAGIYWEMDGMDRVPEYFAAKYGDLPHVVVTPEDFRFVVERHLALQHAQNGDPIVAIEPCGAGQTYDVEMAPDGPLNFIANGIVSHNSHAAAYAQITYQTAYLKANYPVEYMAAFLSVAMGDSDKVVKGVLETKRMGIPVLPPRVNDSRSDFSIEVVAGEDGASGEGIRFGLAAVKNVGQGPIEAILVARGQEPGGRFASLARLCQQVDSRVLNKRVLESLVKAGALDDLGGRAQLLDGLEQALSAGQKAQQAREKGQISLFGALGGAEATPAAEFSLPAAEELPRKTILAWEKEMTGLYLSEHPLSLIAPGPGVTPLGEITEEQAGHNVTIVAMIDAVRRIITKRNTTMGVLTVEDLSGTLELVAFPECFEKHGEVWQEDTIVRAVVKVDLRNDQVQLICESAEPFVQRVEEAAKRAGGGATLRLTLATSGDFWQDVAHLNRVNEVLRLFEGDDRVIFHVRTRAGEVRLLAQGRGVACGPELEAALTDLLGRAAVRVERPAEAEDAYALTAD